MNIINTHAIYLHHLYISDHFTNVALKSGRHRRVLPSNFPLEEDLVVVREVTGANAHIAACRERRELFQLAASKANEDLQERNPVTCKIVQDRYTCLQGVYSKAERSNPYASAVGGEVEEMNEVLSAMLEARDDIEDKK